MIIVLRGTILKIFPYATCIYEFLVVLLISSDGFPRQHYLISLNDEEDSKQPPCDLK